jgi:sialic acid synthase SpsE
MTVSHVFVIAEAGSNWRVGTADRDRQMARTLVEIAADAGADAVKFQTFRASSVYVAEAGQVEYLAGAGVRDSINDVFQDLEMPYEMVAELAAMCDERGIEFMSTPFSVADADAVDPYVGRHKVASYELNHVRLLERLARTGKPLIVSTGAATEADIEYGLRVLDAAGSGPVTLLQCTASYPAPPESLNVRAIPWLRERFGRPVGLSDHSRDPVVGPVAAVALGATVVEKHFTVDNRLPGPDHRFAIEPRELQALVQAVRGAALVLGDGVKGTDPAELELREFAVRAIQATADIEPGDPFIEGRNVDVLRPGQRVRGLHPRYLDSLAGRVAARSIRRGDGVQPEDVAPPFDDSTFGSRSAPEQIARDPNGRAAV